MSDSANERSENLVGDGDGDGDDGGDDGRGNLRKAKRVSLFRFRRKKKNRAANPSSSSSSAVCSGKRVGGGGGGGGRGGGGGGFCCCFRQTPTLDSPVEPQTSDPNSPEFTYGLLRALVEKNDFYSKECNTHFDI